MSVSGRAGIAATAVWTLVLACFVAGCGDPWPSTVNRRSEEETRRKAVQDQFSSWDGSHKPLIRYIKSTLSDPGSFEHLSTSYDDRIVHIVVTTVFRAKNGAGQMTKQTIVAKVDARGRILTVVSRTR